MSQTHTGTRTAPDRPGPDHPRPADAPSNRRRTSAVTAGRATFRHSLHAEWIKVRTMRSTVYVILGTLLLGAGIAWLNGSTARRRATSTPR